MSQIWIVESDIFASNSVTAALIGNFAVRTFASIDSAKKFGTFKLKCKPDILLIANLPSAFKGEDLRGLRNIAENICLVGNDWRGFLSANPNANISLIAGWGSELDLTRQIRQMLNEKTKSATNERLLRYKDLEYKPDDMSIGGVFLNRSECLPRKEGQILKLLIERNGTPVDRREIMEKVWMGLCVSNRTIDTHVSRLRKRLTESEVTIESIYGGGYKLI